MLVCVLWVWTRVLVCVLVAASHRLVHSPDVVGVVPSLSVFCPCLLALDSALGGCLGSNWRRLSLQAMRYLSYLLYPLCVGGAVYSLLNVKYKRWVPPGPPTAFQPGGRGLARPTLGLTSSAG